MLPLSLKEVLLEQVSSKSKKEVIKLLSVLATFTPVTRTKEKADETVETGKTAEAVKTAKAIETAGAGKDGKENRNSENLKLNLARVPCIQYSVTFQKKTVPISALCNSGSKIHAIYLTFAKELNLPITPTDVEAQKINGIMLDTFEIVVPAFLVMDKAN